jgi:ribonuclease R
VNQRLSNKSKGLRTYAVEIPSRDAVLETLEEAGVPLSDAELLERLGVKDGEEREGIERRIAAMEREGQVLRNRRGNLLLPDKAGLIKGKVIGHPDGFGFLQPEDGRDDLFLGPKEMHKVLHGDIVLARVVGVDRRGRLEGAIAEVLERGNQKVVGRLFIENDVAFVIAENKRISQDILVRPESLGGAKEGQVVVVEILAQPSKHAEPVGRVLEVLGNYADPGMEIEIALRKHDLPHEWPRDVETAAKKIGKKLAMRDLKGRKDLRELAFVTIDGETAKDFDDAVYCEPDGRGWRLIVAIADVSHYVHDGDALDADARERGTSVYFPRRVIPMLPEELSNELCSLKADVDRLCMACDMRLDARGAVKRYEFYPAVMHSHARLTYTRVWEWLSDPQAAKGRDAKKLLPHLSNLYALYKVLAAARARRGAIDFDTVELALEFDPNGKIVRIVPAPRNDAHKLIEECMLAANVCAAGFLAERKQPTLYRVHEGPPPDKLAALREFLAGSALSLGGGDEPTATDYFRLIESIKERPDFALLQTVLLRSLSQAQYSPENVGHFGLAYDAYAHFTSPIRRYPDLLVHRCIKAALAGKRYTPAGMTWQELGVHTSMTERRADDASRDVLQWLKCHYMQDKVGETYSGTISGVASFGIFVTLDGLNIDGLVHVTELPRDYFHFDQARHALIGERGGRVFQLAGRVSVRVARVDLERARIDFTLAENAAAAEPGAAKAKRPMYSQPLSSDDLGARTRREEQAKSRGRGDPQSRERRSPRGKRRR